ncbi:MAG: DUF2169 domain-containing protein [Deltaproteobacteria bacterium]|nr:DUF2169 domain-containing protein [Myxococcales bacterium]MDP3214226.1 DUF2169 domain-containing protein [Deltaproteobacteria bacterium]
MDFINETCWDARLFTGAIDDAQIGGWMVARATFEVDRERGRLIPSEVRWPVFHEQVATRYGTFPSDNYPMHKGCDLVVLGRARCRRPTARTGASFTVGGFTRSLDVIGDRRWVRGADGALVPSEPEPFTEMALDWTNAYGGSAERDGERLVHAMNPVGRGSYPDADRAEGQRLPNLEDPAEPIRAWSDGPTPAAWGPIARAQPWQMHEAVRARGWTTVDAPGREDLLRLARSCTPASAVPRNVAPAVRGDESVCVALGDDRWDFELPGWNLRVRVAVGAERFERRTEVSALWFLADTQLLVVSFRSRWRYLMRPREVRAATLYALAA